MHHSIKSKAGADGYPFLFVNNRTGKKAIICIPPKVGSTVWKQVSFVKLVTLFRLINLLLFDRLFIVAWV